MRSTTIVTDPIMPSTVSHSRISINQGKHKQLLTFSIITNSWDDDYVLNLRNVYLWRKNNDSDWLERVDDS